MSSLKTLDRKVIRACVRQSPNNQSSLIELIARCSVAGWQASQVNAYSAFALRTRSPSPQTRSDLLHIVHQWQILQVKLHKDRTLLTPFSSCGRQGNMASKATISILCPSTAIPHCAGVL